VTQGDTEVALTPSEEAEIEAHLRALGYID
jgi:hypothetical protein